MLQLVKNERSNKHTKPNSEPRPNYVLIELCDESLEPVASPGDLALIAQYAPPVNGDLVAYQHDGDTFVRWWRQVQSSVIVSDAHGNEQILHLTEILVLGVVREIRRPIIKGAAPQRQSADIDNKADNSAYPQLFFET